MAISLNSVFGFNSTLPANCQHVSRSSTSLSPKVTHFGFSPGITGSRVYLKERRRKLCLSVTNSDRLVTDSDAKGPGTAESSTSQLQSSVDNEPGLQSSRPSNGSAVSSGPKQETRPNTESVPRRSPLTARERLRAARILSRYTEPKPSKSEMGNKVLAALKEGDKGKKRSGLPEAPTNLFDDSDRGLPKDGWTFQFPGGADLFVIAFSFVFISTVMFATTYIVWKVGAIHFNEY